MDQTKALDMVRKQLPDKRYIHTLGVVESAQQLAEKYGADTEKAKLAAIFHDYAKYRPLDEMKEIIKNEHLPQDLLEYNSELWHAPVGAVLVEKEADLHDEEILSAIRNHTSGCVGMSLLDKIIYLADYIEPGRNFPGVDEVRAMAEQCLDKAVLQAMGNTITFLIKKNQTIYPDTFHAYNDLASQIGRNN